MFISETFPGALVTAMQSHPWRPAGLESSAGRHRVGVYTCGHHSTSQGPCLPICETMSVVSKPLKPEASFGPTSVLRETPKYKRDNKPELC